MKLNYFFFPALILASNCLAQVDDYFPSVVRITAQKDFGEDIGTGTIIGQDGRDVFILTALHVVRESAATEVLIYKQKEKHTAELASREESLDLAVLKIRVQDLPVIQQLYLAGPDLFEVEAPVRSIGHPAGGFWKLNPLNKIQETELYEEERKFSITPQAIVGGCSGGPVFLQNGAWLGMVTETSMVEGTCVKGKAIEEWLKKKRIPAQYIYFPNIEMIHVRGKQKRGVSPYQNRLDPQKIDDFYLAKYELSVADFQAFILATGYKTFNEKKGEGIILKKRGEYFELWYEKGISWEKDVFGKNIPPEDRKKLPVIHVSVNDARAYCQWLSFKTGQTYRLPALQEMWYVEVPGNSNNIEYAPRENVYDLSACLENINGISDRNVPPHESWRWDMEEHKDRAYYTDRFPALSSRGQFSSWGLGFHDLFGNVSEWCTSYFYGQEEVEHYGANWLGWVWGYLEEGDYLCKSYSKYDILVVREIGKNLEKLKFSEPEYTTNFIGIRLARNK